jgi:hypothetical protein
MVPTAVAPAALEASKKLLIGIPARFNVPDEPLPVTTPVKRFVMLPAGFSSDMLAAL